MAHKTLKDQLRFHYQFYLLMHTVGRTDEAMRSLEKLEGVIEGIRPEIKAVNTDNLKQSAKQRSGGESPRFTDMKYEEIENPTYEQFEKECDRQVTNMAGLGIHDLADASWRDYFDTGMTPRAAIECANDDFWDGELNDILHGQLTMNIQAHAAISALIIYTVYLCITQL